jgi:hypothetical protein
MEDEDGFDDEVFRKGSIYPDKVSDSEVSIPIGSAPDDQPGRINRSISYAVNANKPHQGSSNPRITMLNAIVEDPLEKE